MRHETQRWDKIRALVEIVIAGAGQTGKTPTVGIKRLSDGNWLANGGGSWVGVFATNNMSAVDAVNLPGLYQFEIAPADLDVTLGASGYLLAVAESTTSLVEYVKIDQETGAGEAADQVWEEALADHSGTVGSTAEALDSASSGATPATIAAEVWDTLKASHNSDPATFGGMMHVILGMVQGNHRIKNPTYDADGRLLTATLAAYATSVDADTDTPLTEFGVTCTYDVDGNLQTLLSKE